MAETAGAFVWIGSEALADSQLVAAATGGIHKGLASIGVITPFMSYGRQAGSDRLTMNAVRIWADILMLIQMIGPSGSEAALEAGADRTDEPPSQEGKPLNSHHLPNPDSSFSLKK